MAPCFEHFSCEGVVYNSISFYTRSFLSAAKVLSIQQKEETVKISTDCGIYDNSLDLGYSPIEVSL